MPEEDPYKVAKGQRAAVAEHVEKWRTYPDEAKNMALRTIRNAQGFISRVKDEADDIEDSWEDSWSPQNDNDPRAASDDADGSDGADGGEGDDGGGGDEEGEAEEEEGEAEEGGAEGAEG